LVVTNKNDYYSDLDNSIIGIDEVGRGALCGPVVSCALILHENISQEKLFDEITDSKKLSEKKRVEISMMIKRHSKFNIGISNNMEIDRLNILNATTLSMKRAYSMFKNTNFKIKIDGLKTFELNDRTSFHVKGDQKSVTIAAASIIAKVYRDDLMIKLSSDYPQYGWHKNKGYGTKQHILAIKNYGVTKYHRLSFLKNLSFG
jgi:ribonuclease HII